MAYSRWGMTNADAQTLTGLAAEPTDADLEAAEAEIVDWIVWEPDPADYTDANGDPTLAARGFGRAVAWQAAYRDSKAPSADDGGTAIESESIDGYRVTFAGPHDDRPEVAAKVKGLLQRYGWRTDAGKVRTVRAVPPDFQTG